MNTGPPSSDVWTDHNTHSHSQQRLREVHALLDKKTNETIDDHEASHNGKPLGHLRQLCLDNIIHTTAERDGYAGMIWHRIKNVRVLLDKIIYTTLTG